MKRLLVTVDSLRYDYLNKMRHTTAFLDDAHDAAYTVAAGTFGVFPVIMTGEFVDSGDIKGQRTWIEMLDCKTVGITSNRLLSPRYGYDTGFDVFVPPKDRTKDGIAAMLTKGSRPYRFAASIYGSYQRLQSVFKETPKAHLPADVLIDKLESEIDDDWFAWLHFMDPHHPYDPFESTRVRDQRTSRMVHNGEGSDIDEDAVRRLYASEIRVLDRKLKELWSVVEDAEVVFTADHGELLGEDGLWGHPAVPRPELLHVPFGTKNITHPGPVVSLQDIGSMFTSEARPREVAFASVDGSSVAMNKQHIATANGVYDMDMNPKTDPELVEHRQSFAPSRANRFQADKADLEALGYL